MNSNEESDIKGQTADPETGDSRRCNGRRHWLWKMPLLLILLLVKVELVVLLWNYMIPELFHLPTLDYLHALGLMMLIKLMFGFHHHHGGGGRGRWGRHPLHKHWHRLSREEREKLRETLRKRWEC